MTDKEKLLKLADYFDAMDALHGNPRSDVQKDLRRIAKSLESKDAEIAKVDRSSKWLMKEHAKECCKYEAEISALKKRVQELIEMNNKLTDAILKDSCPWCGLNEKSNVRRQK